MNLTLKRYNHILMTTIADARARRKRFARLLTDRPTDIKIKKRTKNPEADLKNHKHILAASFIITGLLHAVVFLAFPQIEISSPAPPPKAEIVVQLEEIPETRQYMPPPLVRPTVPLEIPSSFTPQDVILETTDLALEQELELDLPPIDVPSIPQVALSKLEPEIEAFAELWEVEEKPELIKQVRPEYPRQAQMMGLEGQVFLKVLVGTDGKVEKAEVIRGNTVFHSSAIEAAKSFEFKPAYQNGNPVRVWMLIPLQFRFTT